MMRGQSSVGSGALVIWVVFAACGTAPALAWDPFVSPNRNVEEGNAAMAEGDHVGALEAYSRAQRELPDEAGVHLNRGLALMASGQAEEARASFVTAVELEPTPEIRADAYYDMGLTFYSAGDAAAQNDDHRGAQQMFREAADSFRRSLRAKPGNRDAAWNLELAMRRIREQEEEQRRQEEEQQAQNDQQQRDPQQDPQDQDGQQDQNEQSQDSQQQDSQDDQDSQDSQDPQQQDPQQQDPQPADSQDAQDQQGQQQPGDQSQERDDPSQEQQQQAQGDQQQQQQQQAGGQEVPDHVARVLDALQNDEENLQRHRARIRGQRENRQPTMDW